MKKLVRFEDLKDYIRVIEDYPKKGVSFKDISPLLANFEAFNFACEQLIINLPKEEISKVLVIEARGFIFGSILALVNSASLVLVRKSNKLVPDEHNTIRFMAHNEYGNEWLGFNYSYVHNVIFPSNFYENILLHDDILATGGTVLSVFEALISKGYPKENIYFSFLIELSFLKGRDLLISNGVDKNHISSVIIY